MANGATQEKIADAKSNGDEKASKPRTATEYVVLVKSGDKSYHRLDGTFKGFRRDDVLQELVESGKIVASEDDGKRTPEVVIAPARGFVALRATVETRQEVTVA